MVMALPSLHGIHKFTYDYRGGTTHFYVIKAPAAARRPV